MVQAVSFELIDQFGDAFGGWRFRENGAIDQENYLAARFFGGVMVR